MFNKRKPETEATESDVKPVAPEPLPVVVPPEPRTLPEVRGGGGSNLMKPSIISEGFELIGDLISTGVVHVEGSVRGKLSLSAITIGSKGSVEGTIQCETLHVKGRFTGTAHCRDLTLSADALVDGQVYYSQIAVQRGAKITGELIKK
jgi:cytoskeletal protein CcmA (bactofilin family)